MTEKAQPLSCDLLTQTMNRHHGRQQQLFGGRPKRLLLATLSLITCSYIYSVYKLNKVAATENGRHLTPDVLAVAPTGKKVLQVSTMAATVDDPQSLSSVDYMACCGAGHRMSKLAEANYLSHRLGFGLRPYWGYCNTYDSRQQQTEVFHFLFGSIPVLPPTANGGSRSNHLYARINNDVPGFHKLIRDGDCSQCKSTTDKVVVDQRLYSRLRDQFRNRPAVEAFRQAHFVDNGTVVGVHIRAGNGEDGDFSGRKRGIGNLDKWLEALVLQINGALERERPRQKAIVFVATDTAAIIPKLQAALGKTLVVHWEQTRPTEGSGVLFGEQGKVNRQGEECLDGWTNTITDMMLLSHADILIAARPSSFTQSLPMSLVYAAKGTFCEVNPDASDRRCYKDFATWCCEGRTLFSMEGIKQKYDYLRMPAPGALDHIDLHSPDVRKQFKISERPIGGCIPQPMDRKQVCLPYDWSDHIVRPYPQQRFPQPRRPNKRGKRIRKIA